MVVMAGGGGGGCSTAASACIIGETARCTRSAGAAALYETGEKMSERAILMRVSMRSVLRVQKQAPRNFPRTFLSEQS